VGRNRETGAETTGSDKVDAMLIGGDRSWRRGCTRCVSAGHDDLDSLGAVRADSPSLVAIGNAFRMRGSCFSVRGDASVGNYGKNTSHGNKLSGVWSVGLGVLVQA
jgi:hypothetical protein